MFTIKNFNQLPKNEQVYKIFREGTEVLSRQHEEFIIKLFSVAGLFVEIWYNAEKNIIEKMKCEC